MKRAIGLCAVFITLAACNSAPMVKPIEPVAQVDLARFMGDWHVIAHIPTFIEKQAFNAVENYALNADGSIATTFTFNKGSADGPLKRYTPKGFVRHGQSNAVWGMQFVWPIKAEYIIADLSPDYSHTIVARNKRDYVWIMARQPQLPPEQLQMLTERVRQLGYDTSALRIVPQTR